MHTASHTELILMTRSHLKIRVFVRDQGVAEYQSAGILKYVEDLRRGHNADIGRKNFFEIASIYRLQHGARPWWAF